MRGSYSCLWLTNLEHGKFVPHAGSYSAPKVTDVKVEKFVPRTGELFLGRTKELL